MNTTELLMQMSYVAGQIAQSYFPQVSNNTTQSGQSDFQTMLKEKQSQSQSQNTVQQDKPASSEKQETQKQDASVQQTTDNGQVLQQAQQVQQLQTLLGGQMLMGDAVLASGQMQPMQQMNQSTMDGMSMDLSAAAVTLNAADVKNVVQQQVVQPMAQTQGEEAQGEGFQMPQQQVEQTQTITQDANTVSTDGQDAKQMMTSQDGDASMQDVEVTVDQMPQDVQQPLFQETESMPVKVGDAPVLDTTVQPEEFDAQLNKVINDAVQQNMQHIELKLNPANLGSVVVELSRSPEGMLHVVLHADNQNAAKLLSEHSANLGLMLQNSNGTQVRVEVSQAEQNQQPWQQPDQNGGQQQQQQQQPRQQRNTEDFLHQIRLGLLSMDVETEQV